MKPHKIKFIKTGCIYLRPVFVLLMGVLKFYGVSQRFVEAVNGEGLSLGVNEEC